MPHLPKVNYGMVFLAVLVVTGAAYMLIPSSASGVIFTIFGAADPSVFNGLTPFGHYKMGFALALLVACFFVVVYSVASLILSTQTPEQYVSLNSKNFIVQRQLDFPALLNRDEFQSYLSQSAKNENVLRPSAEDFNDAEIAVDQAFKQL